MGEKITPAQLRKDLYRLLDRVIETVERGDLLISPMVLFEFQMLHEMGRVEDSPDQLMAYLQASMGVAVCELPWDSVVRAAAHEHWTRDPFDRLIVANARVQQAPLLTADRNILTNYPEAFC